MYLRLDVLFQGDEENPLGDLCKGIMDISKCTVGKIIYLLSHLSTCTLHVFVMVFCTLFVISSSFSQTWQACGGNAAG